MSASPNGLPPLPKPPTGPVTEQIDLELPGDLMADLKRAAKEQGMDLAVAVAMCVVRWRYPPEPSAVAAPTRRRIKRA
jgi:hypothetical protein